MPTKSSWYIYPDEITPPLDHEIVDQMARQINGEAPPLQVKRAGRLRPLGNCYWNAARVVEESDGQVVFGWMILWWPKLYGVAMHHAVWRNPDGRLIDVTESKPGDERASHSVFVVDGRIKPPIEKIPCIDNLFVNFSGLACVDDFIRLYQRQQALRRNISQVQWEHGHRCVYELAIAAGRKQEPPEMKLQFQSAAAADAFLADRRELAMITRDIGDAIERMRTATDGH